MPVYYNDESGQLDVTSETCSCGNPMYDTGCDAPGCPGYRCDNCGTGCDVDLDDSGRCATALAEESDEDYAARVDRERAAFGLSPLGFPAPGSAG